MNDKRREEQLKDRQDLRQSLIERRNNLDRKIDAVEKQISDLKKT